MQPFYYQNLAEAEFVVGLFMYMRLIGYPGEKISILTTYNGQKHLIRDVLRKRCQSNPLIGQPKKITTVDKYQGQQNDYILLSLVKTKNIGHLRDVRRLIVAMSRARLGLYIFARVQLFKSCYELTPVFNSLLKRPTQLELVLNENYQSTRKLDDKPDQETKIIKDMPEMVQFVYDFYKSKLDMWTKMKRQKNQTDVRSKTEERIRKLDEEEKVLRGKLNETVERSEARALKKLNVDQQYSSSSSSSESENENEEYNKQEDQKILSEDEVSQKDENLTLKESDSNQQVQDENMDNEDSPSENS